MHKAMGAKGGNQQRTTELKGVTSGAIKVMMFLNLLSIGIYAVEWYKSGEVITSSGARASGHHEGPATLAFLTYVHQVFFNQWNGWHPLIGKLAILSTIVCLAMATMNLKSGIENEFVWAEALPIQGSVLKFVVLVWNEAVNIHQFILYAPLFMNQLWKGYVTAKDRHIEQHAAHMRSATMFLLGPLFQRFWFNHLTDRPDDMGFIFQAITYSILMFLLDCSTARYSIRITIGIAIGAGVIFVVNRTSALNYMLLLV
jgi:hypothetical protein